MDACEVKRGLEAEVREEGTFGEDTDKVIAMIVIISAFEMILVFR